MLELLQVIGLGSIVGAVVYYFDKKETTTTRYDSKGRSFTEEDGTKHYKYDSSGRDISDKNVDKDQLLSSAIQKYTTTQCKSAPLCNTYLADISNKPASRFCFNL